MTQILFLSAVLLCTPLLASCSAQTPLPMSLAQLAAFAYVIFMAWSAKGYYLMRQAYGETVPLVFYALNTMMVLWSGLMYINLIFKTPFAPYVWYADWIISVPILVIALALTAMVQAPHVSWLLIVTLMGLQGVSVSAGLFGHISPTKSGLITFFSVSVLASLTTMYILWVPIKKMAHSSSVHLAKKYTTLLSFVSFFWFLGELIWILGSPGYRFYSDTTTQVLFVILPLLAKVGFGYLNLFLLNQFSQEIGAPLELRA